jgi:hypothetical protein
MPLSFAPLIRLKLCHACDQCHSSRVFTPLFGWHCKLRPNTEGQLDTVTLEAFALVTTALMKAGDKGGASAVALDAAAMFPDVMFVRCAFFDRNLR